MSEVKQQIPIVLGMLGWSTEAISQGKWGFCWFPVGPKDEKYAHGRVWLRVKVLATEVVREKRDVIVADEQNGVKEHTPVELSYEKALGGFQRVTENYPLPVTAGSKAVTHVPLTATAAGNTLIATPSIGKKIRVHWYSISNDHNVTATVGMRFGSSGTIKHEYALAADGGNVIANLLDSNWEGAVDESLYAWLSAAYANGVYFNIGYSEE